MRVKKLLSFREQQGKKLEFGEGKIRKKSWGEKKLDFGKGRTRKKM